MHLGRKLFLIAVSAATSMVLNITASAAVTVSPEVPSGAPCGTVTVITGHAVTGGCHLEFSSDGTGVPLHGYTPARITISNCEVNLEVRMGSNGEGWVVEMLLSSPHGGEVPCTREPCDEFAPGHRNLLWPVHLVEHGAANEEAEAVFCLRPLDPDNEGDPGSQCEIHLGLFEPSNHVYQLGDADADNGTEIFCENNPPNQSGHISLPFPVSIEPHFVTSGTERVEINHAP